MRFLMTSKLKEGPSWTEMAEPLVKAMPVQSVATTISNMAATLDKMTDLAIALEKAIWFMTLSGLLLGYCLAKQFS